MRSWSCRIGWAVFPSCWAASGTLFGAAPKIRMMKDVPWPQWRGPGRDALSSETGLLKEWPKGGPPLAWKATRLGQGYSGVSVGHGRVYTLGTRNGKEIVIALEESGGKEAWTYEVGPSEGTDGGYAGPRSTPTIDVGELYALGINGDLVCLEASSGRPRWRKNLVKDRVLCTPGGEATIDVELVGPPRDLRFPDQGTGPLREGHKMLMICWNTPR